MCGVAKEKGYLDLREAGWLVGWLGEVGRCPNDDPAPDALACRQQNLPSPLFKGLFLVAMQLTMLTLLVYLIWPLREADDDLRLPRRSAAGSPSNQPQRPQQPVTDSASPCGKIAPRLFFFVAKTLRHIRHVLLILPACLYEQHAVLLDDL